MMESEDPSIAVGEHEHWVVLAWSLAPAILVAILGLAAGGAMGEPRVAGVVVLIAALWAVIAWLRWYMEWLTLTSQRVVLEAGVLVRSVKVIPLDHIQDITTHQSILGRLLGYGTLEIDAMGREGVELVRGAPRPNRLRERVFEQQRLLTQAEPGGEEPTPPV